MVVRHAVLMRSKQRSHGVEEPGERAAVPVSIILVDHGDWQVMLASDTKFFGQAVAVFAHELRTGPRWMLVSFLWARGRLYQGASATSESPRRLRSRLA